MWFSNFLAHPLTRAVAVAVVLAVARYLAKDD